MQYGITAQRAGVSLVDLEFLSKGTVTGNIAESLGVPAGDIERFIKGSASAAMTIRLGLDRNLSAADEIAKLNGTDGAIGIVLGLLLARG